MSDPAITGSLGQTTSGAGTLLNPQVSTFNPESITPAGGPTANDQYSLSVLKYPSEIGATGRTTVPSYVTFNIYVPTSSPYSTQGGSSTKATQSNSQNNSDYQQQTFGLPQAPGQVDATGGTTVGALTAVNAAAGGGSILGSLAQGALAGTTAVAASKLVDRTVTLKPQLSRIGTSIQLYMPDTVMSSMNHSYRTVDATTAIGNLRWATLIGHGMADAVTAAVKSAVAHIGDLAHISEWGDFGNGIFNQLAASVNTNGATKELAGKALEATGLVGSGFTDLALRSSGIAVNPQVELIYNGTKQRSFIFEFRFTPRSAQESQTINKIIQTFKQFSSPGIQKGSLGRYFIVPAQFDITFNFQNTTNPFIGRISTCALESINVNYVGQGQWATFPDGSPAEIMLQLTFIEAEIIYDDLVQQGY